ncbi:MAG: primosomal protein N' [Lachnospiraceae bacterium]|nr:primosomal protein N' [Lachnospiraceae bacterium]
MTYANVIVDISVEKLDKSFQYRIPEELKENIEVGVQVDIPFGSRTLTGYVIELTDEAEFDVEKIRPLIGIHKGSVPMESQLIALAGWMRKHYGSTMNQALKAVLPIRRQTKHVEHRKICLLLSVEEARQKLALFEAKHYTAKARLLRELIAQPELDYTLVTNKLNISVATIRGMQQQEILSVETIRQYRNPVAHLNQQGYHLMLNEDQQRVADMVIADMDAGRMETYLLKGVTGSGKTEVYMELIAHVLEKGRQAIMLIPEIALTYQTVMRFYNRFGDRVSIMNSRLSMGERYDQFERAKAGDIDIMIGPRSALFAPFPNLGLIIIDEEHETSYKSETAPRYHAREVAIERARMSHASVVLGSATPSIDSYYQAKLGNYRLLELNQRVKEQALPSCEIVDMRKELREGNRSILSERLQELMEERLEKQEQIMLFLNRRGVSGFISCRACGYVLKCPHCDVSLSQHAGGRMICHYCGYEEPVPEVCPSCGSKYLGGFKAGTQKIEMLVQKRFPKAKVLRMDFDTTRTKDSYEKILQTFANHEADILIGTQMIVKGHDFANVTLVGVLAADMSLHVPDFHASERTFQLLTQAVGRAGRGEKAGQAIIQTYNPDHFAIQTAQEQNYESFYAQEIAYRNMLLYPPVWNLLVVHCAGEDYEIVAEASEKLALRLQQEIAAQGGRTLLVGPADAAISRINDVFRKVIYMKSAGYEMLVGLKDDLELYLKEESIFDKVTVQFDFNPTSGF